MLNAFVCPTCNGTSFVGLFHLSQRQTPLPCLPHTPKEPVKILTPSGLLIVIITDNHVCFHVISLVHHVPTPLKALHLPSLQFLEVLLAQMYPTNLITHNIRLYILLWPFLCCPCLPHGLLKHTLIRLFHPSNSEIHPRSHLLNLHPRQFLSTLLRPDQINPEMNKRLRLLPINRIPHRNGN